jgi:CelD/BcsL family acetyltransferase involved in cellulose biosynthesis
MKEDWNGLLERSGVNHVQMTHDWIEIWSRTFGLEHEIWILTAENEGKLIGIAPLMIHKVGKLLRGIIKFRQVAFLAYGLQDKADFIISENRQTVLDLFVKHIISNKERWDEVHLRQISTNSPNYSLLKEYQKKDPEFGFRMVEIIGCPFLAIEGDFDTYYQGISKSWRSKNEKYIRKLSKEGNLEFKVIEEITDEHIDNIIRIATKRQEITGRRNIFLEEQKYNFIQEMLKRFTEKGWVKLFFLLHDNKVITYSLTYSYNKTLYRWNTSFDLDYSKFSVGRILTKYMTEYCFENDYRVCDWMAGVEDHKFKWTSTSTSNYLFIMEKKNLKTKLTNFYLKIKYSTNKE